MWDEYNGTMTLPGESEARQFALLVDKEGQAVTLRFDAAVAGASEWSGLSVQVTRRPKYTEVWFMTTGLPKEKVELSWKCNAAFEDDTLAGVVVARPNEARVSGEKGFTLVRASS